MNIWEVSDLKNLIDEFSGDSVIDLNQWAKKEMTEDQRNQLKTATLSVIDGARLALVNQNPFYGTFCLNIQNRFTLDMEAPMAVNVTTSGLVTYMNLYVNPLWLVYIQGMKKSPLDLVLENHPKAPMTLDEYNKLSQDKKDELAATFKNSGGQFVRTDKFKDVTAILYHELNHLLWEHCQRYKNESQNGHHTLVNIATDCQINQAPKIKESKALTEYGITLESVRQMVEDPTLAADEDSKFYFDVLYKKKKELQKQQQQGDSQDQKDQNQDGNGENQDGQNQQNGEDQKDGQGQGDGQEKDSQNQDGDGEKTPEQKAQDMIDDYKKKMSQSQSAAMNEKASHDVWKKTPEDAQDGETSEMASGDASHQSVVSAVKRTTQASEVNEGHYRGLIPGDLIEEAIHGKAKRGKLPLRTVIQRGLGKLKQGVERTFTRVNYKQGNRPDISKGSRNILNKEIICYVDNSGSMGENEINFALNEISAIAAKTKSKQIVYQMDTQVYSNNPQYVEKDGRFKFFPTGRGGTSFQPVFDHLKESKKNDNNSTVCIVITDGWGESTIDTHGFRNVVWILVEEKKNTLSVNKEHLRGHQVAWLEDDDNYRLHKLNEL
jgi:predicted metal-dependent peptidase